MSVPLSLRPSWGALLVLMFVAGFVLIPLPLLDKMTLIGFGICPQRAGHSYFLGGTLMPGEETLRVFVPFLDIAAPIQATKLPLEARMYGMFVGFFLTWAYSFLIGRGRAAVMPRPLIVGTYIAFIAVMGIDGINATLYDLNNSGLAIPYAYSPRLDLRFFTGWLCGIAMAGIVLPVLNYSLWSAAEARPMFDRLRELLPMVLLGLFLLFLFNTGSGLVFYPLAFLAPLGVLATVTALNIVLVITLHGRERVASGWWQALNPLAIALCLAILELGALSLVRYAAFGFGEIS